MKRLFALWMSLVFCLACFTGCTTERNPLQSSSTPVISVEPSRSEPEPDYKKPVAFTFQREVLSSHYRERYGESFMQSYHRLIEAFFAYDDTFVCNSQQDYINLQTVVPICFPLFDGAASFDVEYCYSAQNPHAPILYSTQDQEEHQRKIDDFIAVVTDWIEGAVYQSDDPFFVSLGLYQAVSSQVSYDYEVLQDENSTGFDVSPYQTLMTRNGICRGFAGAYVYLLLQMGIDAIPCGGLNREATLAHDWALVELDGRWYYMDPTFENGETGGEGLLYFGMTTQDRDLAGDFDPSSYNIGHTNQIWGTDIAAEDNRFASLHTCRYFEFDRERQRLACYYPQEDEPRFFYR